MPRRCPSASGRTVIIRHLLPNEQSASVAQSGAQSAWCSGGVGLPITPLIVWNPAMPAGQIGSPFGRSSWGSTTSTRQTRVKLTATQVRPALHWPSHGCVSSWLLSPPQPQSSREHAKATVLPIATTYSPRRGTPSGPAGSHSPISEWFRAERRGPEKEAALLYEVLPGTRDLRATLQALPSSFPS